MQPGELTEYVEVQEYRETQATDGSGDRIKEYQTIFPIYASKEDVSTKEFISGRASQVAISHRFIVRFSDVEPGTNWNKCRLFCDGLYYRIIAGLSDNRTGKEWVTLACESGVLQWQDLQ